MKGQNAQFFEISDSFSTFFLLDLVAYLRFLLFDGNKADLILANQNAPEGIFKGTNLPPKNLELEKKVWETLCKLSIQMLQLLQLND
jgi:hypothetical protein